MKKLNLLLVTCLTAGLWATAALAGGARDRETLHKAHRGTEARERAHVVAAQIGPGHRNGPVSREHAINHRSRERGDRASPATIILGGIIGGIAGNRLAAPETRGLTTIAGTIVGAAVGYELGRDARHFHYFHPAPRRHVHRHFHSPHRHVRRHVSYHRYHHGGVHYRHRHGSRAHHARPAQHHRHYYSRAH